MNHRAHIGTALVRAQVHGQLGRRSPCAAAHRTIETEFHEILRADVHLRQAGRRNEQRVIAKANGNVPVLTSNEPALVQAAADGADRLPDIIGPERGGYPIR